MTKIKFEDVATRVNTREDRLNTSLLYYVGGEHIESNEMLVQGCGLIKGSTIGPMFYCGFKKGDVLLVSRNPHLRKASMVEFDGICSEKTFVLGTKDSKVLLQEFLALVMQSDDFWNYCEEHKSGGVNYFLNWSTLAKYEFYLPSIQEQKEIADKVWSAYRLKESYKKLLIATDEMLKSQFIEMIHGCKHVPLNKVARFSKTSITPTSGTVYTLFSFPAFDNDCTPEVVDGSDIKSSKIKLEEDVILYNKLNVRLSRVWNIEKLSTYNNICSSEFMPIKVMGNDVILKSFLYRVLCSDYVTKKMVACSTGTSNSQKRIAPTSLLNLGIPVPTLEQQNQFVSIAQQADKSKFELKQCIENIDKVIKSLING